MSEFQQQKTRDEIKKVEEMMNQNPAVRELIDKHGAKIKEIKIFDT
ncbi:MAG: hypothetical protein HQM16_11040 [Deltaproteobacteria bacterium]|nr:hypothetical protein [Deltaproteobacteria bacterium]